MKRYLAAWIFILLFLAGVLNLGLTVSDPLLPVPPPIREEVEEWSFIARTTTTANKNCPAVAVDQRREILRFAYTEQDDSGYYQIWTASDGAGRLGFNAMCRTRSPFNKDTPHLVVHSSDGRIHYVYVQEDSRGHSQIWTVRMSPGEQKAWPVVQRTFSPCPSLHPQLVIDERRDRVYCFYDETAPNGVSQVWAAWYSGDGGGWTAKQVTSAPYHNRRPQACLDPDSGRLIVAFETLDENGRCSIQAMQSSPDCSDWNALPGAEDGLTGHHPRIAVNQETATVFITFIREDRSGIPQIWCTLYSHGSGKWTERQLTKSSVPCRNPRLLLAPGLSPVYLVYERDDHQGRSQIWTGRMNPDTTGWRTVKRTSELDIQFGMPIPRVALHRRAPALTYHRKNHEICFVYLEQREGWQIVSARIPADRDYWDARLIPQQQSHFILDTPRAWFDSEAKKIRYVYRGYTPYYGQQIWTAETSMMRDDWEARRKTFLKQGVLNVSLVSNPKTDVIHYTFCGAKRYPVYAAQSKQDGSDWFVTNKIQDPFSASGNSGAYDPVHDRLYYVFAGDEAGKTRLCLAEMNSDGTGWKTVPLATLECSPDLAKPAFVLDAAAETLHLVYVDGSYEDGSIAVWTARVGTDGTGWRANRRLETFVETPSPGILFDHARGTLHYMFSAARSHGGGKLLWTAEMALDGTGWKAIARTDRRVGLTRFTLNDRTNRLHYAFDTDDQGGLLQLWTAEMKNDGSDFKAQQRTYNLRSHNSFNVTLSPGHTDLFFVYQEFDGREAHFKTAFLPLEN